MLILGGLGGVFMDRLILPYVSNWPLLKNFQFLKPRSPVTITRREEIRINDGVNTADLANHLSSSLVTVYFHEDKFDSPKFKLIATRYGAIMTSDGIIAVAGADLQSDLEATVVLSEAAPVPAKIVAEDSLTGVTLLKIQKDNLPIVKEGFSQSLTPGEKLLLIYSSETPREVLVAPVTVSNRGIVAASFEKTYGLDHLNALLAIDTNLSDKLGAVLVNKDGMMTGFVSQIGRDAVVIRAEDLKFLINNFFDDGKVTWSNIKISYLVYGPTQALLKKLPEKYGVFIKSAAPPLLPGDFVFSVNGKDLGFEEDFQSQLLARQPGDKLKLRLMRAGEEKEIEITL